jgi:hypothetical protein
MKKVERQKNMLTMPVWKSRNINVEVKIEDCDVDMCEADS